MDIPAIQDLVGPMPHTNLDAVEGVRRHADSKGRAMTELLLMDCTAWLRIRREA